jgi:hypothetical protein
MGRSARRSQAGGRLVREEQAPSGLDGHLSFGHEANPVHGLDADVNALGSSLQQVTLDTVQGTAPTTP